MITILKIVLVLLLSPIAGCLLSGLDRKITARMQNRVGPPLLQPYYDIKKLLHKENIAVNRFQNVYVLIYFMFIVASLLMLFFQMDLLMIIFVFTIANIALIVGSISTGSPFSKVGSQREMIALLAYEPVLVLFIVAMYMLTGSFRISSLSSARAPMLYYLPLIFVAMLFIMVIKFKKSPFDFSASHHAHQELVKGIFTEFSGPALGIIELAHCYESIFLLGLMFLFGQGNILLGLIIAAFTFIFVIVVDNISARMYWQWMLKISWTILIGLCIINILCIYIFQIKIV